jgi:beta-glucosidase
MVSAHPESSSEKHIDALLSQLTLEQKVRLVSGADAWSTCAEPAIGLAPIVMSDGPVGVRGHVGDERDPSVTLPSPTALAATWDESLVARLAEILASEARRKGVHVLLGPTLNLHRSPLGGRHFECYSEDPLLTARIGVAYIRALQSFGIGATPKHYVANDSETERLTVDVVVDERTLRELYLSPFEQAVAAGAWLVMSAYNSVNGQSMSESSLLLNPLKREWGFDGLVVSDWTAVRSTIPAALAANDLAMPGPSEVWGQQLVAAVRCGLVAESDIDQKVRRILRLAGRVGSLKGVEPPAAVALESPSPGPVLREAAAAAMVLVRNEGNFLPLSIADLREVAVIGLNAAEGQIQGGGSAGVIPPYSVSPIGGLRAALGDKVEVTYSSGVDICDGMSPIPVSRIENPETGAPGIRVRLLDAEGHEVNVEDREAVQLAWSRERLDSVNEIEMRGRVRASGEGNYQFGVGEVAGAAGFRLEVNDNVLVDETVSPEDDQVFSMQWLPHRSGEIKAAAGEELDVVLTLRVAPHRLAAAATMYMRELVVPEEERLARATAAAVQADAVVVVVGTTPRTESEGFDRTSLVLPGRQDELVRVVAEANPRTVVVVNSGAPVEMPWRSEVAAVLLTWFPGQEFGNALADVLVGIREPGGRLPTTWPVQQDDVPVLATAPQDGKLAYREGLHLGYRAWARIGRKPAYPFGHGLGYTNWSYRSLEHEDSVDPQMGIVVRVHVANVGNRSGREVVQVYLQRPGSSIERPALWLAGFAPVTLGPGEEADVEVPVAIRAFEHWSVERHRWEREPGPFTLLAGSSAADLPLDSVVILN